MITYHCDTNIILKAAFNTISENHHIEAYNSIRENLEKRGHKVKLQLLDKKAKSALKKVIEDTWNIKCQLVPPNDHFRNAAERAI